MKLMFTDRYAVRRLDDGGLLVDLTTGDYLRLNRTASIVCQALGAGVGRAAAVDAVARELRISVQDAQNAMESVESGLENRGPRREPIGPFRFTPDANSEGYVLSSNDVPQLWASSDGRWIRRVPGQWSSEGDLYEYVRAISPKLLFLRGALVVHGAGCVTANGLRAFCGESGAGKTTTARAFVAAGAAPFSEDLLIVDSTSPLTVHSGGERAVHGWARATAGTLSRAPGLVAPTEGLQAAFAGEPVPVQGIWMIDAGRRSAAPAIAPQRLGCTDAAAALMGSLFLGAGSTEGWRRFLELAAEIAQSTPIFNVPMPDGIERLQAAAGFYRESSTS